MSFNDIERTDVIIDSHNIKDLKKVKKNFFSKKYILLEKKTALFLNF
jgi:hypothetical protein